MKKLLSIGFVLMMAIGLTACGETQEEKNQKKALMDGFKILKNIGEMGQKGASGEEIGEKAMDGILNSLGEMKGENGEKLSDEEKETLREGMDKGMDFFKEMKDMVKDSEKSGKSDEDISMDMFGKIIEMQAEMDEGMTDEERADAKVAAEMFKDGGKKFKEEQEKLMDKMKADVEASKKKIDNDMAEAREKAITQSKPYSKIGLILLDGSELATQLKAGGGLTIGCDDTVTFKELSKNMTPKEVIEASFVFDDFDQEKGYYNVFHNSKNLKVKDLSIDDKGLVTVNLSGDLITGGMCDDPRVYAQIQNTVKQLDPFVINDVEVYINGKLLGDYLSEKDEDLSGVESLDQDTGIHPTEEPNYDALVDDPAVYEAPPAATQSFILTHDGKMWEDICFENLGNPATFDVLVEERKNDVLDDEWSFIEYGATTANVVFVDSCPAKYDVSCDYEDKDVSFEFHFDSENSDNNEVAVTEKTGDLKYRAHFSPTSYSTTDEKGMIRASCLFQENEVQGIENRLDADGEWK